MKCAQHVAFENWDNLYDKAISCRVIKSLKSIPSIHYFLCFFYRIIKTLIMYFKSHSFLTESNDLIKFFFSKSDMSLMEKWTLLMLKPEYSGRTRSLPWLLMPSLLVSPGQPWHWLGRINWSLSSTRKNVNYCWETTGNTNVLMFVTLCHEMMIPFGWASERVHSRQGVRPILRQKIPFF